MFGAGVVPGQGAADRLYAAVVGFRPGVSDLGARSRAVGIAGPPRVPLPLHPGGPRKGDGAAGLVGDCRNGPPADRRGVGRPDAAGAAGPGRDLGPEAADSGRTREFRGQQNMIFLNILIICDL